jgi:hypothetical protein
MTAARVVSNRSERTAVARPLKVLVPLIQQDLEAGDSAGLDHYRRAGEKLSEAREQVTAGRWGAWLSKNFELSRVTAWRYMKLAQQPERFAGETNGKSLTDAIGERRSDQKRQAGQWRPIKDFTSKVPVDDFRQEQQRREDEVKLHREIALQLVSLGYRALATRLHPDHGGSKEAMVRLNRVRDELNAIANTRRFL